MIGKIMNSVFPYYDGKVRKNKYKKRPVLVIAGPRNKDYTVLPVSTVTKKQYLDKEYDIEIDPTKYPKTKLDRLSYVRVHKQTIVNQSSIVSQISNLKEDYPDVYSKILTKLREYNELVMEQAL